MSESFTVPSITDPCKCIAFPSSASSLFRHLPATIVPMMSDFPILVAGTCAGRVDDPPYPAPFHFDFDFLHGSSLVSAPTGARSLSPRCTKYWTLYAMQPGKRKEWLPCREGSLLGLFLCILRALALQVLFLPSSSKAFMRFDSTQSQKVLNVHLENTAGCGHLLPVIVRRNVTLQTGMIY